MSTPKQFDKATLRLLRNRLNMALAEVSEDFGITIKAGNCRFNATEATFKIHAHITQTSESGEVIDPQRAALLKMLPALGLTERALEREFVVNSEAFKLVGYKSGSRTRTMCILRIRDGKRFVANEHVVVGALRA